MGDEIDAQSKRADRAVCAKTVGFQRKEERWADGAEDKIEERKRM